MIAWSIVFFLQIIEPAQTNQSRGLSNKMGRACSWLIIFGECSFSLHGIAVAMIVVVVMIVLATELLVLFVFIICNALLSLLLEGVQKAHKEESDQDKKDKVESNEPPHVVVDRLLAVFPGDGLLDVMADGVGLTLDFTREEAEVDHID